MSWIIYGGIAILMVYMMSKGGGCCGGGHATHNSHENSHGGHQGGGCCGGGMNHMDMGHSNHGDHDHGHMGGTMNSSIGTVQDPVCGMYVSKNDAISRTVNGRIYYFCSQNCADEFQEKYSA